MISSECASHSSLVAPQAVMPWPPRTTPIACGLVAAGPAAMSRPSWNPGPPPRHPQHPVAEALLGQRLAVGGGGQRDPRVGVQVVDVRCVDQAVHRGVDRRRGAAAAVQAVVERRDHLVLALDAGVDVDERAQPVEPQHREARRGEGAEVAAGALDPQQLDRRAGDRVGGLALGRGVAAGVVGVARVGAEPVAAGDELLHRVVGMLGHGCQSLVGRWAGDVSGAPAGLLAAGALGADRARSSPERW